MGPLSFDRREATAVALLSLTLVVMVVGPFYYNLVTTTAQERGEGKVFYVTAKQWVFVPDHFVVHQGEKVTFIVSTDDVAHGFSIKGYDVGVMVLPGGFSKLTLIANMTGTFNIICFVDCGMPFPNSGLGHHDMNATLTVLPS